MRFLCLVLAAALLLGPPPARGQASTAATLSPSDAADAGRILLLTGDPQSAVAILEVASAQYPAEPELWFLLGLAQRDVGELGAALVSLRRAAELAPSQPRPLLEVAAILVAKGQYDEAYETFGRALRIAPDRALRRNIRRWMDRLLPLKTFALAFGLRIQPDQNPSGASGRNTVNIGGLDFQLDRAQRARPGLGLGGDVAVRYAPALNGSVHLVADGAFSALHFFGDCCDDYQITAAVGPGWFLGANSIVAQAFFRYRGYDQDPYTVEHGLRLEVGRSSASFAIRAGGEVGEARLIALNVPGDVWRGYLSTDVAVAGNLVVGSTMRLEELSYDVAAQSYRTTSLEVRAGFDGPFAFPLRLSALVLRRAYGGPSISSEGNRVDHAWAATASVEIDSIAIWGVSPIVGVSYQQQSSNEPLAVYNRASVIFALTRLF